MSEKEFRRFLAKNEKGVQRSMKNIEEASKRFDKKFKEILALI